MFWFWKTKIDETQIKNIDDAMRIIKVFIKRKKWDKAHDLLSNTLHTEKTNLQEKIEELPQDETFTINKANLEKAFTLNISKIKEHESLLLKEESKYRFIPENIKKYEDAIKWIKTLMLLEDWEKAKKTLKEIKAIEKDWFDALVWRLNNEWDTVYAENEKESQLKSYNKKEEELNKMLQSIEQKELKAKEKKDKERFKIRFKKIKNEIDLLKKTWKSDYALKVLKNFLEENKHNSSVITFYNKQKWSLLKSIEKQRKKEDLKFQKNLKKEAMRLAWWTLKLSDEDDENTDNNTNTHTSILERIKWKLLIYKTLKERLRKKKLLDEVTLLIEENAQMNSELAKQKLANIHKGLTKEIFTDQMHWFDLYGKVLWSSKISGDTFWIHHWKKDHKFFIWDATWHWIKAGLIVTLLTKAFTSHAEKHNVVELTMKINNALKQDLQTRNFITWMLFQVDRENTNRIHYVWMWHEPLLVYRKETQKVEQIVAWWLAAWIRKIEDLSAIKAKDINVSDGDTLLIYSDWAIECQWINWTPLWIKRLSKIFWDIAQHGWTSTSIYKNLITQVLSHRWGSSFDDDVTMIVIKRDASADIQKKDSKYLKKLQSDEKLDKKDIKKLVWKDKIQIQTELKKIKKEKELNVIVTSLKKLYHLWEFITLKQEAIRFIKEWWVHKDINFYLKKAVENETKYKINLKNAKIANKYKVLEQLLKSWDFDTVIHQVEDIISKEWDI